MLWRLYNNNKIYSDDYIIILYQRYNIPLVNIVRRCFLIISSTTAEITKNEPKSFKIAIYFELSAKSDIHKKSIKSDTTTCSCNCKLFMYICTQEYLKFIYYCINAIKSYNVRWWHLSSYGAISHCITEQIKYSKEISIGKIEGLIGSLNSSKCDIDLCKDYRPISILQINSSNSSTLVKSLNDNWLRQIKKEEKLLQLALELESCIQRQGQATDKNWGIPHGAVGTNNSNSSSSVGVDQLNCGILDTSQPTESSPNSIISWGKTTGSNTHLLLLNQVDTVDAAGIRSGDLGDSIQQQNYTMNNSVGGGPTNKMHQIGGGMGLGGSNSNGGGGLANSSVSGGGNNLSGGQSLNNQQQLQQANNSQQQQHLGQSGLNGNNPGSNNNNSSNSTNNNTNSTNNGGGGNNTSGNGGNASGLVGGGTSAAAAKNQLEQLNTMREALFSQDGWGCQHVNQDTNWDVPGSPEPVTKGDPAGPQMWKPNINNGTDLWEVNLRNGGQPPPQPVQKTPWGHTPSTNLGGTWGEDDDGTDTSNVWTGAPANPSGPQWGQPAGSIWPPAGTSVTNQKKDSEWGSSIASGNAWADPRDMRTAPIDMRNVDPRELRTPSGDPRDLRGMIDPRDSIRDLRGDPRGISGRLNGNSEMWGQHHTISHGQMPLNKMVGPGGAVAAVAAGSNNTQWGSTQPVAGPKDIAAMAKPTGWDEPSPPAQRRNISNYDDGTSLWGQQARVPGVSHWKDMPDMTRNHLLRSAIGNQAATGGAGAGGTSTPMPQGRHGPNTQVKPDNNMWSHAGAASRNNGAWDDQHTGAVNWEEKAAAMGGNIGGGGGGGAGGGSGGAGAWNDSTASAAWNKNPNKIGTGSTAAQVATWPETDLATEWGNHGVKPQPKLGVISSELIRSSKQYRYLTELGFKKEDVELTLRATNLSLEEAHEILSTRNNAVAREVVMDSWRRHEDPTGGFDHSSPFTGRFPGNSQAPMPFPPSNNPNLLNNMGGGGVGGNPSIATINNMQPLQVPKYLSQAPHNLSGAQTVSAFGQAASGNHNSRQPSDQQLRMLVQQIQMAVQGGYLSGQILNQPLAPTTLILLNQLLSNIKHLQGAQTSIQRNPMNNLQLSVTITKYKQQITNLQNQINAQQALYVKQQQAVSVATSHVGSSSTEYLRGQHDAISALQSNFSEISLNKDQTGAFQGAPNQQSRLNQWKLPTLEKEVPSDSTDFSRAPGPTAKPTQSTANANNMGTLGLQNDVTWSSARNFGDGWPDPNNENENKDWPAAQPSPATAFTDLVPEFEPGKPWKGSQMKSIEDDPSITPGSVARSPLSINPTPKDADLFANSSKTSPTDLPPLSLSSTTWSFNPSGSQQNYTGWSDNVPQSSATTSELWGTPMNKSSRGPPPGLGSNKSSVNVSGGVSGGGGNSGGGNSGGGGGSSVASVANQSVVSGSSNGWIGSGLGSRVQAAGAVTGGNWPGGNPNWHSTWLLLKNLTTQIDGSTLRTLCMQHGPLQNFHLYLNQGIALCKYSTHEEANKAQMALNNCVLGNTTICAESPNESEVQNILQHLQPVGQSQPQTGGNGVTGTGSVVAGGGGGAGVGVGAVSAGGGGGAGGNNAGTGQSSWRPQNQPNPARASGSDTWGAGAVWPSPNAALWTTSLDGATERGTPSNLKSFLPENLLELN